MLEFFRKYGSHETPTDKSLIRALLVKYCRTIGNNYLRESEPIIEKRVESGHRIESLPDYSLHHTRKTVLGKFSVITRKLEDSSVIQKFLS